MRRILTFTLFLMMAAELYSQTLPVLLLTDHDARGAALCCPGAAAGYDVDGIRASAGFGRWVSSGEASSILSAEAATRLPFGLETGLSAVAVMDRPYSIANAAGKETGTFSPVESAYGLSLAYDVKPFLKTGVRLRFIHSSLGYGASASAVGADIGAMYVGGCFRTSVELCNIGSAIDYGYGPYAQPSLVRACASWRPSDSFLIAADADCLFSGAMMAGVGAEYTVLGLVSLRAGYHYGDRTRAVPGYAAAGCGFCFKGFSLDAAFFVAAQSLSGTAIFRAGYRF